MVNPTNIKPFKFKFGGRDRTIIGGPYFHKDPSYFGVKMAVEIRLPCDVDIPTQDFSIPDLRDLDKGIRNTLIAIARNKDIYVGCAGGIGRTGLFFGALMKLLNEKDPVKYVRDNYKSHAIETPAQVKVTTEYKPSLATTLVYEVAKVIALAY